MYGGYSEIRGSMKVIKVKSVIFLGIPLLFLLINESFSIEKSISGVCSRVLDGDTVIVNGQRIRLANIDAPESSQYSFDGIPIGEMSTDFLTRRIQGKFVVVKYFLRGRYGRVIGSIWIDDKNINNELLEKGMALVYGDGVSLDQIALEYTAKLNRKGIFKTVGFSRPAVFRSKKRRLIGKAKPTN